MEEITIFYLEMNSLQALNDKTDARGLLLMKAEIDEYRFNRYLYQLVGEQWQWTDKLSLPDEDWKAYVENPGLHTWVAYFKGAIAGYYELQSDGKGNVEIMYFGLAPDFIGGGFGGHLLSQAIKSAWAIDDTNRVWLHTCSLDHPSALQNYKSRGFEVFKEEKSVA